VAGRIVAACIFAMYAGYIVVEIGTRQPALSTYSQSQASLLNAIIGFVVFGLPAGYFALNGRLPGWRPDYRSHISFTLSDFDRTERKDFINPGNLGEDLIRRLAAGLATRDVVIDPDIGQEDFGWAMLATESRLPFFVVLRVRQHTPGGWLAIVDSAGLRRGVSRRYAADVAARLVDKVAAELVSWNASKVKLHFVTDFTAGKEELGIDPTLG
jgi:hypothetical protein